MYGTFARVPDRVRRTPRYEDEAATRHLNLAVAQQKRRFSVRDVERLVRVRVQMQRWRRLTRWKHADNRDVGTGHLGGTKVRRLGRILASNDRASVDSFHRVQPMHSV